MNIIANRQVTLQLPGGRSYAAAALAYRDVLVLLRAPALMTYLVATIQAPHSLLKMRCYL